MEHGLRAEASYGSGMARVEPLSSSEEMMWRALMRIVKTLPRHLDSDLVRSVGLTASEYTMLMHLSEASNRELRMADLAEATGLSASRTTRLVGDLQSRGLVTKRGSSADGRSNIARLAPRKRMAKLKSAWPVHLSQRAYTRPRPHRSGPTCAGTAQKKCWSPPVAAQLSRGL
jgi:DNA-binding MarR family transcriptional regulator